MALGKAGRNDGRTIPSEILIVIVKGREKGMKVEVDIQAQKR